MDQHSMTQAANIVSLAFYVIIWIFYMSFPSTCRSSTYNCHTCFPATKSALGTKKISREAQLQTLLTDFCCTCGNSVSVIFYLPVIVSCMTILLIIHKKSFENFQVANYFSVCQSMVVARTCTICILFTTCHCGLCESIFIHQLSYLSSFHCPLCYLSDV